MKLRCLLTVSGILSTSMAWAAEDFGTLEEAQGIASRMTEIIQAGGVDAGINAMHDDSEPFAASALGIHVFEDGIIVADNREPELLATSYEEVADLTGEPMWPRIVAAADASGDAILEWYHYDTEAEYTYACHSEWAQPGSTIVMVCR